MTLPADYFETPLVRANLVQGPGGIFVDASGSSRGISNVADRDRLLALRGLADVVVTDGETARRENYRVPSNCDLAVITRTGFTPSHSNSTHRYIELRSSIKDALRTLIASGYKRILLECGPNLVTEAIAAGLVDELCLTSTLGAEPDLSALGIDASTEVFAENLGDTTFRIYRQIRG